jgi:hypothetical protein
MMPYTFKEPRNLSRLAAIAVTLAFASSASAALQDRGPQDPVLVFPQYYRDLNGTALGLCKSQVVSPNAAAAGGTMCFPLAANPSGFAGNLGDEIFYNNLNVLVGKGAAAGGTSSFALRYVAGLEAAYTTANPLGAPVHGNETVFARIRIVMNVQVPGTYTVTHPFGVEVFPDVEATGARAVFFTADVPLGVPMNFDLALDGRIGPFIEWDVLNAGETLTVGTEQFVGDPNILHTYKGSPFGTNFVRVDGPPGSNLDGAGNDSIIEVLGNVEGQRWTAPIATPFRVQKAVYGSSAAGNVVDVWAASSAGQSLVLTGADLPSVRLAEYPGGLYYGHVEYPATAVPPSSVTVTNLSSVPVIGQAIALVDQLDATAAYDPATRAIQIAATSSDLSGPKLVVLAPFGGPMTPGTTPGTYTFSGLLAAGVEPPMQVRVESNAGGVYLANTVVGTGAPMNPPPPLVAPIAVSDTPTVSGSLPTTFDVSANDTYAPATAPKVLILTQPTTGTAVAAASGGNVTYTPTPGASGPDSFTYVLQDAVGISNVATVSFTVPFVAPPPTAVADNFAMLQNTSKIYAVLGNDTAASGTSIAPGTVLISTPPAHGTAVPNADGTITYTPVVGFNSALDTFAYTVANNYGTRSAPATVTVDVFGGAESLSFSKVQYTTSQSKWTITGSTNWFNAALTQGTVTCWTGTATSPTPTTLIGTAPIDTTGKFQLVPVGATPKPANPSSITCKSSYGASRSSSVTFK